MPMLPWPIRKGIGTRGKRLPPVQRHGNLSVSQNKIVDERGEVVALRGMSLFWSQLKPQFFNSSVLHCLRDDWNVDVVRAPLAVHDGGYLQNSEAECDKMCRVIQAAIDLDLYVIVDWHSHEPDADHAALFFRKIAYKYGQ